MSKKIRLGRVVSTAMTGTVTVSVDRQKVHPLYGKAYRASQKFQADPAGHELAVSDLVKIEETRPLAKTKNWKVIAKVS